MPVRPLERAHSGNRHPPAVPEPALGTHRERDESDDALACWVRTARVTLDACLVVDAAGAVAALSATAAELLGASPAGVVGRPLDEVLDLVGYTDAAQQAQGHQRRIPPLVAVHENGLARGIMRIRLPGGERRMLDAVAAPIHDVERRAVGAVTFLASV